MFTNRLLNHFEGTCLCTTKSFVFLFGVTVRIQRYWMFLPIKSILHKMITAEVLHSDLEVNTRLRLDHESELSTS